MRFLHLSRCSCCSPRHAAGRLRLRQRPGRQSAPSRTTSCLSSTRPTGMRSCRSPVIQPSFCSPPNSSRRRSRVSRHRGRWRLHRLHRGPGRPADHTRSKLQHRGRGRRSPGPRHSRTEADGDCAALGGEQLLVVRVSSQIVARRSDAGLREWTQLRATGARSRACWPAWSGRTSYLTYA